jgi:DNA-binding LytR/AlgR family response regulator
VTGSPNIYVRMTLNEAATLLPNALFVQTHRSHLVNLLYAAEIVRADRRRALCLTTGDYVPVSRTRINTVQSKLKAFVTVSQ